MILDEILAAKRAEVEAAKARLSLAELQRRIRGHVAQRGFRQTLAGSPRMPALIAELKRQSPSKGMLRERFDPVRLAQELQEAGASALSILTDERFFGGSLGILRDVQPFVDVPILRKDFIIDPYQIYEALYAQADAVLLIVRALSPAQLREFIMVSLEIGIDTLVEVHEEAELEVAIKAGATLIGINHRNLDDFTMDHTLTDRLIPRMPPRIVRVAESGVHDRQELQRLKALGVDAVLIGEALMTAPEPGEKVRELFQGIW